MPWNPSQKGDQVVLYNGNTEASITNSTAYSWQRVIADAGFTGATDVYFEISFNDDVQVLSDDKVYIGINESNTTNSGSGVAYWPGRTTADGYGFREDEWSENEGGGSANSGNITALTGLTFDRDDIIGVHFSHPGQNDTGELSVARNDLWWDGTGFTKSSPTASGATPVVTGINTATYYASVGLFRIGDEFDARVILHDDEASVTYTPPAGSITPISVNAPVIAIPLTVYGFDSAPYITLPFSVTQPPGEAPLIDLVFRTKSPETPAPAVDLPLSFLAGTPVVYPIAPPLSIPPAFLAGTPVVYPIAPPLSFSVQISDQVAALVLDFRARPPSAGFVEFPLEVQADAARHTLYRCEIVADGYDAYLLPIKNFQAVLNYGAESFLSVSVHGIDDHHQAIVDRTAGELRLYYVDVASNGAENSHQIAVADITQIDVYKGSLNRSIKIEARRADATPAPEALTIAAGSYISTRDGGQLIHRSAPDKRVKPGDLVTLYDGTKIIVSSVRLNVSTASATMELEDLTEDTLLRAPGDPVPFEPTINITAADPDTRPTGDYTASPQGTVWTYDDGGVLVQGLPWDTNARS